MKIPTSLKVGGLTWTVELNNDVCYEGSCAASSHFKSQKIYLDPTTTQQAREKSLIHEILHVVWEQCGFGDRAETKGCEEEIVKAVAYGLHQVFTDNPELLR